MAVIGVLVYIFRHYCGKKQDDHVSKELRDLPVDRATQTETHCHSNFDDQGQKKIESFSHMEKKLEKTAETFSHSKRQELESKTEIGRSRKVSDV